MVGTTQWRLQVLRTVDEVNLCIAPVASVGDGCRRPRRVRVVVGPIGGVQATQAFIFAARAIEPGQVYSQGARRPTSCRSVSLSGNASDAMVWTSLASV